MRLPEKNNPEWAYATHAREMAYRALWVDSGKPLPISPMPRRWRGHQVYKFSGFATPLRQFAITRFVEAQRAAPPTFRDPILRCHAASLELWVLAHHHLPEVHRLLSKLKAPIRELQRSRGAAKRHRQGFEINNRHLRLALQLTVARRAVRSALRYADKLAADEHVLRGGSGAPYPSVLALRGTARDAALCRQAQRLYRARLQQRLGKERGRKGRTLVEIGWIMGWEKDTDQRTSDAVRHRFDYLKKKNRRRSR